jgi:hypothetical protein
VLAVTFTGFPAFGFGAEVLVLLMAAIGKKKSLAVLAFTGARTSFHRFQNPGNQNQTVEPTKGKKIPEEEDSEQRRRNKNFQ